MKIKEEIRMEELLDILKGLNQGLILKMKRI